MKHHGATRAYAARRTLEVRTPRVIKRCLERYLARQLCQRLQADSDSHRLPLPAGLDSHRALWRVRLEVTDSMASRMPAFRARRVSPGLCLEGVTSWMSVSSVMCP
jgi:hypothetical protein